MTARYGASNGVRAVWPSGRDAQRELADALHEVICAVSHHDRRTFREARCYASYPLIARSALDRLGARRG